MSAWALPFLGGTLATLAQLDAIVEAARGPYKAAFLLMAETGMRIGEVVHLTHDDLTLTGPAPVAHIRPKDVVPGARPWRPKNGEQRAVPLSPRAVAMLRGLPRRRRWVIDRMNGTAATANQPANDRHILAYLTTVLAKLGLEDTNHKFRHSFCTIAVLSGVNFFTLRRWGGHIDEEALKNYVHIADKEAQVTKQQLAESRQACRQTRPGAAGHQQSFSKVTPRRSRGWWLISKVTEVNNDSLFKKPWKQGIFASTFFTKRRGRDSNPRSSF